MKANELAAAAIIAASVGNRECLKSVRVLPDRLVSCDGSILCRIKTKTENAPPEGILLPVAADKDFLKMVSKKNYAKEVKLTQSPIGDVTLSCGGTSVTATRVEGRYPDVAFVLGKMEPRSEKISMQVNPELLIRVRDALRLLGLASTTGYTLATAFGPEGEYIWDLENALFIAMPLRG